MNIGQGISDEVDLIRRDMDPRCPHVSDDIFQNDILFISLTSDIIFRLHYEDDLDPPE